jgi:lipoprotein signal peptidase
VADVAICVGVGLMALDMFTSKRPRLEGLSDRLAESVPAPAETKP